MCLAGDVSMIMKAIFEDFPEINDSVLLIDFATRFMPLRLVDLLMFHVRS